MPVRKATTVWENDLMNGNGKVRVASNALPEFPVSWKGRTEQGASLTSPEELVAAAHASCFAMALSGNLSRRGSPPKKLTVTAETSFDKVGEGWKVTKSALNVVGNVPGLDAAKFDDYAREAERSCPISNALRNNVEITINAKLE
jgi:lipoyl-dependent peroxiredoxin